MGTVRYTVVYGEIIAEKRKNVRKVYVPDPSGSTVALLDNTQAQTDSFSYWPYGEVRSSTGSTPTPFRFIGTAGYYSDSSNQSYVRARHLDVIKGRWLNQDPIGLDGEDTNLYRYVENNPQTLSDPSGLQSGNPGPGYRAGKDCACNGCGNAIISNWWNTPQHFCNNFYAHCMACCVLTRYVDAECALEQQELENLLSPSKWGGGTVGKRNAACNAGIGVAKNAGASCHSQCISLYPVRSTLPYDPKFKYKIYCNKHKKDIDKPLPSPCKGAS
jgi:RHS repeat-associated protein